jgi:hypothetical protein
MVDRGKAHDVNEAARRFAETLADSYRLVYEQAAESGQRQQQRAREFSELVAQNLREQAEANRAGAEVLSEQAQRQREVGQALTRESVEAYAQFLEEAFSRYRSGTERATETAQQGARTLTDTTTGLVGTAAGAAGATAGAAAGAAREASDAATFPIPGYDGMTVEEIEGRLGPLTDDQVGRLRDYERQNQNRKTLIDRYDQKLRASS